MNNLKYAIFSGSLLFTQSVVGTILTIDSATSISNSSGGFTGGPIGTFNITGTFEVMTSPTEISFTNIDASLSPASFNVPFFPIFPIMYDGLNFSLPGFTGNGVPENIIGTYDGQFLDMTGIILGNVRHDYEINATVSNSFPIVKLAEPIPTLSFYGILILSFIVFMVSISRQRKCH